MIGMGWTVPMVPVAGTDNLKTTGNLYVDKMEADSLKTGNLVAGRGSCMGKPSWVLCSFPGLFLLRWLYSF